MSANTLIASTIALGALGTYAIYKYGESRVSKFPYPKLEYRTFEADNYKITNPARVYSYSVPDGSFSSLESTYKESLFGNYKKKQHIDTILKEYLQKHVITQKRVVFDTEGWVADIDIVTNVNPNTLVFELDNNSLYEASLDGKNGKPITTH